MRLYQSLLGATLCCAAAAFSSAPAMAQTAVWDKTTIVTFDNPIEVPGAGVLQPGTYMFKLLDIGQGANRHTVQIFNKDRTHLFATVEAIPNERLKPTGKTVMMFYEMPSGQPEVLRAWFYPGDNMGQEFAYPKNRAAELSKLTNEQVPEQNGSDQNQAADQQASGPQPQATQPEPAPSTPPASSDVATAEPAPAPAPAQGTPAPNSANAVADDSAATATLAQNTAPQSETTQNENVQNTNDPAPSTQPTLPQTGSNLPLFGLAGILALALAGGLWFAPFTR